ncbi:glycerophosphodiester phosphodiesterase [Paenibacillaceae bacterium]|nr:glycerophosphodiester phosphodiesterase [Paenibacillaceae bacterium]
MKRTTIAAAHTGCGDAPDNTWASFLEGVHTGAGIVEVDVRVTVDGTAILLHDDSPLLRQYSYTQLKAPELRTQLSDDYIEHELVQLEEILRYDGTDRPQLNLDLKEEGAIQPTVELIRQYNAQNRVFITGHSVGMTERYPDIRVLLNTPDVLPQDQGEGEDYEAYAQQVCQEAADGGYYGLNMNYKTCRELVVELARTNQLAVWVYTVNDRDDMAYFADVGVDAITTRKPLLLRDVLAACTR